MSDEELPEGWAIAPLGDLVKVRDSERVPVNQDERARRHGSVPYYGAAGQVGWIDEALFDEDLLLLGEDGVQFFDRNRPKAYLISGPSWVNNHAHVLEANGVDRRYLKHFLDQADYRGLATGTTRLKLTQAAMRRLPVRVPPAREQVRIIDELERRLSHLDAAERGLAAAFIRLSAAKAAAEHRQLWAAGHPEKTLGDLLEQGRGLANGRSVKDRVGGFPVLRLTCLRDGVIDVDQVKEGAWSRADAEPFLIRAGDFLVARGNGSLRLVGRGGLVPPNSPEVAYPDTLIRVCVDAEVMLPAYLAACWNSGGVRRQLEPLARTTAGIYKVNQGHLAGIRLPTPPLEEQRAAVAELDRVRAGLSTAERSIEVAQRRCALLRRSLLAAAFTGELVPQDPDDEPAELLLERLAAERDAAAAAEKEAKAAARQAKKAAKEAAS